MSTSSVDLDVLSYFAGFAPTESNRQLIEALAFSSHQQQQHEESDSHHSNIRRNLVAAAAAANNRSGNGSSSSPSRSDESEADATLRETINLSVGLMPSTVSTRGILLSNAKNSSSRKHDDDDGRSAVAVASNADADEETLQQMIHLSTGLPISTNATDEILLPSRGQTVSDNVSMKKDSSSSSSNNDDEDALLLAQMIHLSTGLPINTTATHKLLSVSPSSEDGSMMATSNAYNTKNNSSSSSAVDDAAAEETLRQMIHMMSGLPMDTEATGSFLSHLRRGTTGTSSSDDDAAVASLSPSSLLGAKSPFTFAANALLSAMPHLSLPSSSSSATPTDDNTMNTSTITTTAARSSSGGSVVMTPAQIADVMRRVSERLFPMSVGGGGGASSTTARRDRNSPEAVAARSRREAKAKAPSGIPEELLGY